MEFNCNFIKEILKPYFYSYSFNHHLVKRNCCSLAQFQK